MKVIINRVLPPGKDYYAINLFGVIFSKGPCNRRTVNHENIHTHQMRELLYLPFYIVYLIGWGIRLVQKRGNSFLAYKAISFEREAYDNEHNYEYLKKRRPFAWCKYLRRSRG